MVVAEVSTPRARPREAKSRYDAHGLAELAVDGLVEQFRLALLGQARVWCPSESPALTGRVPSLGRQASDGRMVEGDTLLAGDQATPARD